MCNPTNNDGIKCVTNQEEIQKFMSSLYFEMYALSKEEDLTSNQPNVLKMNDGKEQKLKLKSNWVGTYKV